MWNVEMVRRKLNLKVFRRFTSSFTDTGENMNLKPNAVREEQVIIDVAPAWVRRCNWLLVQGNRLWVLCHGLYWEPPFSYSIYTLSSPERRLDFPAAKPTAFWRGRH